jgi:hypothetical protein
VNDRRDFRSTPRHLPGQCRSRQTTALHSRPPTQTDRIRRFASGPGKGLSASRACDEPAPGTVARPSTQARPESTVSRPAPETKAAPSVTRPAPATTPAPGTVARPSTQIRQAPAVSRPAPSNTIYRVEQGNKARQESARGRESLSSPKGTEDGSTKPSPGVSKPAPAERPSPAREARSAKGPARAASRETTGNSRSIIMDNVLSDGGPTWFQTGVTIKKDRHPGSS